MNTFSTFKNNEYILNFKKVRSISNTFNSDENIFNSDENV